MVSESDRPRGRVYLVMSERGESRITTAAIIAVRTQVPSLFRLIDASHLRSVDLYSRARATRFNPAELSKTRSICMCFELKEINRYVHWGRLSSAFDLFSFFFFIFAIILIRYPCRSRVFAVLRHIRRFELQQTEGRTTWLAESTNTRRQTSVSFFFINPLIRACATESISLLACVDTGVSYTRGRFTGPQ